MRRSMLLALVALVLARCALLPAARAELVPVATVPPMASLRQETDFDRYLASLAYIHQTDDRYKAYAYYYWEAPFGKRGCGPASVLNAFSVACGITEQDQADQILLNLMRMMSTYYKPKTDPISIDRIARFTHPVADKYPYFSAMKAAYGGEMYSYNEELTLDSAKERLGSALQSGIGATYIARLNLYNNWQTVIDLCDWLHSIGQDDALVTGFYISSGSDNTGAPFRSEDGHYLSLCFHVGEYARTSAFYVIDSYQKAVPGEDPDDPVYHGRYAMCTEKNPFKYQYTMWHVKPTVVKCMPNEDYQQRLFAIRQDGALTGAERLAQQSEVRLELLQNLLVYGRGGVMVQVKGK